MATDKRKKAVTYKQVTFHQKGPKLKTLLDTALKKQSTVKDRRQSLAPSDEPPIWRLIAEFKIESALTFGVLVQYTPGSNPRLLIDDPDATTMKVEQFTTPPTADGNRREPMDGMLYFAVFDNHLVLLQSAALRSAHLETHLMWLLHHAEALEGTNQLKLIDKPPQKLIEKMAKREVKELEVGGELIPTAVFKQSSDDTAEPTSTTKSNTLISTKQTNNSSVLDALKGLLKPDAAAKLDLEALAGSNIEYTLRVTYKGSTTDNGQKLMNSLGVALRHSDDVHTKISLVGGGSISGEEIRLSGPVTLDFYNGAPSTDEVYEAMRTWLLEKLTTGEVKAS